jgi:acetyltransferase-like isoleucine patch superfamily enzyme
VKNLLRAILIVLPWKLRRPLLRWFFGYQLDPTSRIGLAWAYPEKLILERNASIGHFTVCKGLSLVHVSEESAIGRGNWITGFPAANKDFFAHQSDRKPQLVLGRHSAITNRHIIDCTASVTIGSFTTFAGFRSQILSHSIDLEENRQSSAPIVIGDYCFVGTDCVLLGGSVLPDFSVLGAKSLLNKAHAATHTLYAGVPARPVKALSKDMKYFYRVRGFVH